MNSHQQGQTFVPIILSQDEYNQILTQPPYLHQQLFQEIYQKKQQQAQLSSQEQMHPNLQQQYQTLSQSSNQTSIINIPQIPTRPHQSPQVQQQVVPQFPQFPQYIQYQYQNQNQIQNINPNQNQNQNQNQNPLKHTIIPKAGNLELKFFYEMSTYLFMLEICISLIVNTISALFNLEFVTRNYQWSTGLWIIFTLFIILNLFVLTNPSFVTQQNNQKVFYWIHVVLYVLLMQGLQIAVSGYAKIFSWETNYFYYFYLLICVEFISVRFAIRQNGVKKSIQKYLRFLIIPIIITYVLELITQKYFFVYPPLLLWVIVVVFIGIGYILIVNKIIEKGYNKFQTKDVFVMAISFPILMISPFFDDE